MVEHSEIVKAVLHRTCRVVQKDKRSTKGREPSSVPQGGSVDRASSVKPTDDADAKPLMKKWQLQSNAFQAALKAMRAFHKAVNEAMAVSTSGEQIAMLPLVMKFATPVTASCDHCGCACQQSKQPIAGNIFPFCQNVQAPRVRSVRPVPVVASTAAARGAFAAGRKVKMTKGVYLYEHC